MSTNSTPRDPRTFEPGPPMPPLEISTDYNWWDAFENQKTVEHFHKAWRTEKAEKARKRAFNGKGWTESIQSDAGALWALALSPDADQRCNAVETALQRKSDPAFVKRMGRHVDNHYRKNPAQRNMAHVLALEVFMELCDELKRMPSKDEWKERINQQRTNTQREGMASLRHLDAEQWRNVRNRAARDVGLTNLPAGLTAL